MNEYLAFVDFVGMTIDGKYIYRLDLTTDTETVWGDFFNIAPAALVPDIQPDNNTLSHSFKAIFPCELVIAKKSFCFSMQDCIDGIIPLAFSEIDDNMIKDNGTPFYLPFGEPFEKIKDLLERNGIEIFDMVEVEKGDDSAIDDLINAIGGEDEDDEM